MWYDLASSVDILILLQSRVNNQLVICGFLALRHYERIICVQQILETYSLKFAKLPNLPGLARVFLYSVRQDSHGRMTTQVLLQVASFWNSRFCSSVT